MSLAEPGSSISRYDDRTARKDHTGRSTEKTKEPDMERSKETMQMNGVQASTEGALFRCQRSINHSARLKLHASRGWGRCPAQRLVRLLPTPDEPSYPCVAPPPRSMTECGINRIHAEGKPGQMSRQQKTTGADGVRDRFTWATPRRPDEHENRLYSTCTVERSLFAGGGTHAPESARACCRTCTAVRWGYGIDYRMPPDHPFPAARRRTA